MRISRTWMLGASAAIAALALAVPANAADYFKGKTITMISPVPGGSGLDRLTRAFVRVWPNHIPGKPEIIVKNMPGGGGAKALNFLYERARPDGLTMVWGPWSGAGIIAKSPGLRYLPEKFAMIGSGGLDRVSLMRTDTGVKKSAEIVKLKSFNVGGRRADRALDMVGNLAMEMIGAKYRFIGGYRGMAKIRPAFMSNEVQAANSGSIGYYIFFKDTMLKDGSAIALWSHPNFNASGEIVRSKAFPGVPSFDQVYKEVHGKMPSGPLWETYRWYSRVLASTSMTVFAAPGTPDNVVKILQASHQATSVDPTYAEPEAKRLGGQGISFMSLADAISIQKNYRKATPEILAVMKRMTKVGKK